MIDASKIQRVSWHTFHISLPQEFSFIDCLVNYYNGSEYHFRYFQSPPRNAPYQLYRLGYLYDYFKEFGESGELPYAFYSEFVYRCNNWYTYTLLNFNSNQNGREDKNRSDQGS